MITRDKLKTIGKWLGGAAFAVWLCVVTVQTCHTPSAQPQGFQAGGGNVLTGGAGISKVTTNSPGLLAGSGTSGNPLTATITTSGIVSGTGSSGSPLTATEVGDIAGVTAGSGLINGGTTGTVTLDVGAGSGLTVSADLVAVNAGSGLTADGTNVRANLGAQMTFSAGAIQPNLTGGTCSNGQSYTSLSSVGAGTCGQPETNLRAQTYYTYTNTFSGNISNTGNLGHEGHWLAAIASAGTWESSGTTTRYGIQNCNTSTSAAGACRATANTASGGGTSVSGLHFGSMTTANFEWVGGVSALNPDAASGTATYTVTLGFFSGNAGTNQSDGCYFVYDHTNINTSGPNAGHADAWECWCADNGTRTAFLINGSGNSDESFALGTAAVGAVTLPDTNMQRLKITVTGTTRAEFYYNGTKVCDINTHLPVTAGHFVGDGLSIVNGSAGTTLYKLINDYMHVDVTMPSVSSP